MINLDQAAWRGGAINFSITSELCCRGCDDWRGQNGCRVGSDLDRLGPFVINLRQMKEDSSADKRRCRLDGEGSVGAHGCHAAFFDQVTTKSDRHIGGSGAQNGGNIRIDDNRRKKGRRR